MCSNHELQATLNALGYLEDGQYYKSRDCLNAAKDLVRFIRRDDPNEKAIRRELLKTDVLSNDFIPLMKTLKSKKDAELFDITLRLTVNLTQSAFNCFEMKLPEDKIQHNIYNEIDSRLRQTKEKFADDEFIELVRAKLDEISAKEWEDRPEEEDLIVERLLFLIRNILLIKTSDDSEKRLETDLNSHDLLILSFHKAKLLDTLIKMSNSPNHLKYSVHLLEIFSLILKEQSAEELAKVSENEYNLASKRSQLEKEKDNHELIKIQMKDNHMRKQNKIRINPRHSRFMGTYVATNMKSINDENKLIVHKPARNMDDLLDDSNKKIVRKAKNKMALEDIDEERRSVLFIRIILKKFCSAILKDSYKVLFSNLKDLMQRKQMEDDEIAYYYWLARFLLEFNRNTELDEQTKLDQIRETFAPNILHSSEIFIQRCIEMMRVDKKVARLWAKRAHTCLRCYKETLITLYVFEKTRSDAEKKAATSAGNHLRPIDTNKEFASEEDRLAELAESAHFPSSSSDTPNELQSQPVAQLFDERAMGLLDKIKSELFYVQEFREMFIKLLKEYDQAKFTKNFLRDLVEGNHIFLLLMEMEMKKKGGLNVGSKKKQRKKSSAKKKGKKNETKEEKEKRTQEDKEFQGRLDAQDVAFKEKAWQANFPRVGSLMQNESELRVESDNLMPFDFVATSDQEFDAHKDRVIEKIQQLLSTGKVDDSIALFREARCLWPNDRETFGKPEMEADEEFEVFKNLYMKTLEIKKPEKAKEPELPEENEEDKDKDNDEGIEDDMDEEAAAAAAVLGSEDEDEDDHVVAEENLDFEKFVFQFTHPHVLKSYIMMLSEYSKNSDFLNRCCMSMFERIAYDCKMPQCLYQLRLFALVNQMYKDPLSRTIMNIMDLTQHPKAIDTIYASTYTTEDMFAFFRQLFAKFFEEVDKNPKLFIELLFFKDRRKIAELTDDPSDKLIITGSSKTRKVAWTEEERDELVDLFNRFKGKLDDIKKRRENPDNGEEYGGDEESREELEGDIVDQLMMNMKDGSRKRKEVCNQLVNLGCLKNIEDANSDEYKFSSRKLGRNRMWRPEDVEDLRQCFALIKSESEQTKQPLGDMMSKLKTLLKIKRDKMTIVLKLCDLGLADSKYELLTKSKNKNKSNMDKFLADNSDQDEDDAARRREKKKDKKKKKKKDGDGARDDIFAADSSSGDSEESELESDTESSDDEADKKSEDAKLNSSRSSRSNSLDELPVSSSKRSKKLSSDDEADDLELTERLMELAKRKEPAEPSSSHSSSASSDSGSGDGEKKSASKKRKKELAAEPKPRKKAQEKPEKTPKTKKEKPEKPKKRAKVLDSESGSGENSNGSDDLPLSSVVAKKRNRGKRASQIVLDDDDSNPAPEDEADKAAKNDSFRGNDDDDDDDDENRMPASLQLNESSDEEAAPPKEKPEKKESENEDEDEDDDLMKPAAASKKQRLILSDDED